MNTIKYLEADILRDTARIKGMKQHYKNRNCAYNLSELLCDITMKEIRLNENIEKLKALKEEK